MKLPSAMFRDLSVYPDRLAVGGVVRANYRIAGARAEVILGADMRRFTATRFALLGPAALAFKKGKHHAYLSVEGPGVSVMREFDAKDEKKARVFAARLNALAAAAS